MFCCIQKYNPYFRYDAFAGAPRFMRGDALSLLLSMANVGAYSDVLVVDMVGGLVVGAVAERLGGKLCFTLMLLMPLYGIIQLN